MAFPASAPPASCLGLSSGTGFAFLLGILDCAPVAPWNPTWWGPPASQLLLNTEQKWTGVGSPPTHSARHLLICAQDSPRSCFLNAESRPREGRGCYLLRKKQCQDLMWPASTWSCCPPWPQSSSQVGRLLQTTARQLGPQPGTHPLEGRSRQVGICCGQARSLQCSSL